MTTHTKELNIYSNYVNSNNVVSLGQKLANFLPHLDNLNEQNICFELLSGSDEELINRHGITPDSIDKINQIVDVFFNINQ